MSFRSRTSGLLTWVSRALFATQPAPQLAQTERVEGRAGDQPSRAPFLERRGAFVGFLLALLPLYLLLAAVVPPFDDELYYWCWSRELQLSYYDHPPMVAYLIRLATEVFGQSVLAIRLPAVLSAVVVIGAIGYLSRPRVLLPLILFTPVFTFGAVLITPDTPLLLFWSLYLVWLVGIHRRLDEASSGSHSRRPHLSLWIIGGVILGCGVLGKYTTGLAAIAGSFSFLVAGRWRQWIVGYLVHALVAVVVASPILIHNVLHDFVPFEYQWSHSMSSPEPGWYSFVEFVAIQLLLFGTLPFVVFVFAILNWRELVANPRLRVCTCLFVLPFAFFLFKATRGRIEGNWAFPCFVACWPLVAELYQRVKGSRLWRWSTWAAFALPCGVTVFLAIHLVEPISLLPVEIDRVTRQQEKLAIIRAVAEDLRAVGYDGPVYVGTYQMVSLLRWHGVNARQIDGASRPSHFTEQVNPPVDPRWDVRFSEAPDPSDLVRPPREYRLIGGYLMEVRGEFCAYFWLIDSSEPPRKLVRPRPTNSSDP